MLTEEGCLITDSFLVTIENCEYFFYTPNSFTPNDDGNNENIMFGTQLDIRIVKSLKLYLDIQNVFYDINQDAEVDNIQTLNFQIEYDFDNFNFNNLFINKKKSQIL